tara:strand:+ start:10852 stop:12027 length:1176 start_codon:yes stop_codon:yes gene_type:complete
MKKSGFLLLPIILGITSLFFLSYSSGAAANGGGDSTGSPGSSNSCSGCHSGGNFGTSITISIKNTLGNSVTSYVPGASYTVEYQVSAASGSPKFGFQGVALATGNINAGVFDTVFTSGTQISISGGRYLPEHSTPSLTGTFKVGWIAPSIGTGVVTFYYAGNAVNGNGVPLGDQPTSTHSFTLSEQGAFAANITQVGFIACNGDSNASLNATISNGVPPYIYVWSNGNSSGSTTSTSHQISNLTAGNYSVTVTDANSHSALNSFVVTQPDSINIAFTAIEPTCFTATNGKITARITGGISPYQLNWNTGAVGLEISGLDTGNYSVQIQDFSGCISSKGMVLSSSNTLPIVDLGPDTLFCESDWFYVLHSRFLCILRIRIYTCVSKPSDFFC